MFQPNLHPFYNCNTGYKTITELSKLLYDSGFMVLLPEPDLKHNRKYYISCTDKIKPSDGITNGKFVIFINGQYGIADVSCLKPDLNKTNWPFYGEKLMEQINLTKDKFLEGEMIISITYDKDLVIPKVEIVKASIKLDI